MHCKSAAFLFSNALQRWANFTFSSSRTTSNLLSDLQFRNGIDRRRFGYRPLLRSPVDPGTAFEIVFVECQAFIVATKQNLDATGTRSEQWTVRFPCCLAQVGIAGTRRPVSLQLRAKQRQSLAIRNKGTSRLEQRIQDVFL